METSFLAGSKEIIYEPDPETPELPFKEGYIEEQCTKNGVVKQMEVGEIRCLTVNSTDVASCGLLNELGGVKNVSIVQFTRMSETKYKAEIIPSMEACKGN